MKEKISIHWFTNNSNSDEAPSSPPLPTMFLTLTDCVKEDNRLHSGKYALVAHTMTKEYYYIVGQWSTINSKDYIFIDK